MSGAGKQKYSSEFKRNIAIEMSSPGKSVSDKARELGVGVSTLRRWMKDFAAEPVEGKQMNQQLGKDKGNGAADGCNEYSEQLLLICYRAFDRCPDAIAIIGKDKHLYCNNAYLDLFGYAGLADLSSRPFTELVSKKQDSSINNLLSRIADTPEGPCIEHEYECIRSDGAVFDSRIEFSRFPGKEDLVQVVLSRAQNSQHPDAFNSMVKKDYLTGLYSRQAFLEELRSTLSDDATDGSKTALMLIDLDKFESVQKKVGYEKSDQIIRDIAGYLQEALPDARINARFDCHLFSTLIEANDTVDPVTLAENICHAISQRVIDLDDQSLMLTSSIGLCWLENVGNDDIEYPVSRAAYACNIANGAGGNRIHVYDPMEDMLSTEQQKVWTERILAALKTSNNFSMVYQPIVSLHGNAGENYEAFLRMNNNSGGEYLPNSFIPAAEHAGLMRVVDRWVIRHAIRVLGDKTGNGKQPNIFINLSRDIIVDESFLGWLKDRIAEANIAPTSLVFELAEKDVSTHIAQSRTLTEGLRALGCRTVLDHFGSGLNSFSLLDKIDVDFLKIDGSLIHNLAKNKTSQVAVKSITEMAQSRGKTTIAGFVQDASSLAILWQCGVSFIQGYFLQEPSRSMGYNFSESDFL